MCAFIKFMCFAGFLFSLFGITGQDGLDELLSQLRSGRKALQNRAIKEIGSIGPDARKAVPDLLYLLESGTASLQISAAKSLGKIGAKEAVPILRKLAGSRHQGIARASAVALQDIGPLTMQQERWLRYRLRFVYMNGKFLKVPELDFRFANNRKMDKSAAAKWLSKTNLAVSERAVWEVSKAIPSLAVGSFGEVESCTVMQVLGRDEILVRDLYGNHLFDETVLISGIPTVGITDGSTWEPISTDNSSFAVIGTYTYNIAGGGTNTVAHLIPTRIARRGVTEAEFTKLLKTNLALD